MRVHKAASGRGRKVEKRRRWTIPPFPCPPPGPSSSPPSATTDTILRQPLDARDAVIPLHVLSFHVLFPQSTLALYFWNYSLFQVSTHPQTAGMTTALLLSLGSVMVALGFPTTFLALLGGHVYR